MKHTVHKGILGAPPLELSQLWQVISQHQIIVKTWNFLCMSLKLVRMYGIFWGTLYIEKMAKKNKKLFSIIGSRWDFSRTGLEKRNKNYFVKHFSGSNDRKWVKMAFENLNISFITFHKIIFALGICTTLLFISF